MNNVYLYEMFYGYTEFERNPMTSCFVYELFSALNNKKYLNDLKTTCLFHFQLQWDVIL